MTPLNIAQRRTRNLVICAFRYLHLDVAHALFIANRESHFGPMAQNPSSLCSGVFQDVLSLWPGRLAYFFPRRWIAPYLYERGSVFNPYLNVWVAAFMVKAGGFSPWGG